MSLQHLPRYRAESIQATRLAALQAEPTLTSEVRARARRSVLEAIRRGAIHDDAAAAAAGKGDTGIAALMRHHHVPLLTPRLPASAVPAPPATKVSVSAIHGLVPWVRMLSRAGALTADALEALVNPDQAPSIIYVAIAAAWERWKAQVLDDSGLDAYLPESTAPTFDILPTALDRFVDSTSPYESRRETPGDHPSLSMRTVAMNYIALRAVGDDYLAIVGALRVLSGLMVVPLIGSPEDILVNEYPYMEDLIVDLRGIALWDDDGVPHIPRDEALGFLEEFGFDPENEGLITAVEQHLVWRKWVDTNPPWAPDSSQARRWRKKQGKGQVGRLHDAICKGIAILTAMPTCRKLQTISDGHPWAEQLTLVPTQIGIDDMVEEVINSTFNSGEVEPDMRLEVGAKGARLGDYARRAVMEVAITNLIAAHIDLLD